MSFDDVVKRCLDAQERGESFISMTPQEHDDLAMQIKPLSFTPPAGPETFMGMEVRVS
jgi:hypothetical protein